MQTIPKISRFNQFPNGVAIGEVPLVFANQGKTFHVDSGTGTDAAPGDSRRPFATIDYAIGQCTANNGDIILVSPGHSETVSSAGAITLDVAGVTIIFLGHGADKGTLTFGTATSASIVVSAASCAIVGAKFVAGIDALANPVHVQAADFTLDCDWHDGSSTVEAARVVLTTAAADRFKANVRYHGFTAGNATVNAIRLVGVDDADIWVDFYGVASTAVVEFLTTACTNIKVRGTIYNSGTTDGSKNVVDTATGSTWYSEIDDATAGQKFTGGSGLAIASAGVLGDKDATTTDSINGKIGTDTELADSSLFDLLCGSAGIPSFPAAAAPANNVSLTEVVRAIYDRQLGDGTDSSTNSQLGKKVTRAAADVFDGTTTALFTVSTGRVLVTHFEGEVTAAAIDAGASNTKVVMNPTVGTDRDLCAVLDINGDELGTIYTITGVASDALQGGSGGGAPGMTIRGVICPEGTIDLSSAADVGTGGAQGKFELWYIPLDDGASVASA